MPARILIVDDEAIVAESMRLLLTQLGHVVVGPAGSAEAALAVLAHERPELVLMDINLGLDQEGIALAETIRTLYHLPVVYVTAYADDATLARAKITHPFGYVTKPFESRDLQVAIEIALHNHGLEWRLQEREQELRAQAETYQALLTTSLDGVVETDEDARILEANEAYCRMTGYSRAELVKMGVQDLEANETTDEVALHATQMRLAGGDCFESRHRARDGRLIDVEVSITHVPSRGRFIVFLRDITARKQAEAALRASEARFHSVWEQSVDGMRLTDGEGILIAVNEAFCRLVGQPRAALVGKLFTAAYDKTSFDSRGEALKRYCDRFARRDLSARQERRITFADGRKADLEISSSFLELPGGQVALLGLFRDVTERKRAELVLQESERMYATLIDNLPGFVYRCANDRNWTMIYFSPGVFSVTGYRPEDFIQNHRVSYDDVIHPDYRGTVRAQWQEALRQRVAFEGEYQIVNASGAARWVWERGQGVYADDGTVMFLEGFITDITSRRQAEQKYHAIFDHAIEGIFQTTPEGLFVVANRALARILGYTSPAELIRKRTDLMRQGYVDPAVRQEFMRRIEAEGSIANFEYEVSTKDGRNIWVTENARAVRDSAGRVCCYEGSMVDITKRKGAEAALRESEEKFAKAFRDSPAGMAIRDLETGCYLDVNDRCLAMTGYTREEVIGRSPLEVGWLQLNDRDENERMMLESRAGSEFELRLRHKEGHMVTCLYRSHQVRIAGRDCLLSITLDVTAQKQAEAALRESELRYRTLADSGQALIWTAGLDKKCDYFNQPWLAFTGRTLEQELGDGWVEGVHPADLAHCIEVYTTAFDRRERFSMDYRLRARDGEYRWIQDVGNPRYDHQGNFLGYIGHCLDIHARKAAEAAQAALSREIERKNRELENLVYITSHDLRSPMLNIQGFSQRIEGLCTELNRLLAAEPWSEADRAALAAITTRQLPKALNYVLTSVEKMDRLISGLLRLSRVGRAGLKHGPLDLNAMLREIVGSLAYAIQETGTVIKVGALPACHGDAGQINQLFTNLLDNALKYRDAVRPQRVAISGRVENGRAIFCVADTGAGIAPQHLDRIWEIFFRANPDDATGGEGLGLNLVRRIVERHNGEVWVESTVGEGSRFYVALPVAATPEPAPAVRSLS